MEIIKAHPPNYDDIRRAFPDAAKSGVLFAYDGAIYNPDGVNIPEPLIAHETVHLERQKLITPDTWWDRYIHKPEFRLIEEAYAHKAEYEGCLGNRKYRRICEGAIARRLAGPLYGRLVSVLSARRLIKGDRNEWAKLLS